MIWREAKASNSWFDYGALPLFMCLASQHWDTRCHLFPQLGVWYHLAGPCPLSPCTPSQSVECLRHDQACPRHRLLSKDTLNTYLYLA